jgi:hypothetical protein
MVAQGVEVKDAYAKAGYTGGDLARCDLRRSADVDARVNWILAQRIKAATKRRHASEKPIADLRTRVKKRRPRRQ